MATLTEVSYYTRRIIKWGAVGFVVILIAPLLLRAVKKIYLALNPPPPPAPTVRYGKLPGIKFPAPIENYKPTFRLETIEGQLPVLPNVGRAYVVEINKSRLLELDRIKPKAKSLGFAGEPEKIDEQTFKFIHPELPAEMKVNIISGGFSYVYDWTTDQRLFSGGDVPNGERAILEAKNFWQSLGLLPADINNGTAKFTYLAAQPPQLIPTISLSEANFIRVDMFRESKDGLRIVAAGGESSPVNITFSGAGERNKRVVEANYNYSKVIDGDFATYPLKSTARAWDELQQGGGYVARDAGPVVTVRKVSLGYYESEEPQEFLQPVFVFEGDNGFVGYVGAVTGEYIQ